MSEYKKTESEATQLHRSFCEPSYVLRIAKIIDYTIPEDSLAGQTLREWQTTILKRGEIIDELIKEKDRKSTRLNSSHTDISRMPSSA